MTWYLFKEKNMRFTSTLLGVLAMSNNTSVLATLWRGACKEFTHQGASPVVADKVYIGELHGRNAEVLECLATIDFDREKAGTKGSEPAPLLLEDVYAADGNYTIPMEMEGLCDPEYFRCNGWNSGSESLENTAFFMKQQNMRQLYMLYKGEGVKIFELCLLNPEETTKSLLNFYKSQESKSVNYDLQRRLVHEEWREAGIKSAISYLTEMRGRYHPEVMPDYEQIFADSFAEIIAKVGPENVDGKCYSTWTNITATLSAISNLTMPKRNLALFRRVEETSKEGHRVVYAIAGQDHVPEQLADENTAVLTMKRIH
jgi:hypothetical protein